MEEKTDIKKVREAIINLAEIIIPKKTDDFPIIVSHPFLNTRYYFEKLHKEKNIKSINLNNEEILKNYDLTNANIYREWVKGFTKIVNKVDLDYIYMLFEKPYKLFFIKYLKPFLSLQDFSKFLAKAWVDEENPNADANVNLKESIKFFKESNKEILMTKEDYEYYNNLPENITIYRGVAVNRVEFGLSWTDNFEKAKWFQNRFNIENNKGKLLKANIRKNNMLAYFNTRNEKEIIVDVFKIKKDIVEI